MNDRTATLSLPVGFRKVLACVLFALAAGTSQAAKDTPFGIEIIPANFPYSTPEQAVSSIAMAAQIGSHGSKIWHWNEPDALNTLGPLVQVMRYYELKVFLQVGATFIGEPGPPSGYVKSFANGDVRTRYLLDVQKLAMLRPDYLVLATEANLMHRFHPAEFENYRFLYTQAYYLIKAISPNTKVGVSYLYSLWFADYYNDGVDVPAKLAPSDFVAFATYPEWLVREGHFSSLAEIPPDWYGASRLAYPNKAIIISEIGWASKVRGTPEIQAEFVHHLPRLMSTTHPELVTWAVQHDVDFYQRGLLTPETTAFLESLGVDIDALFGHFNGMGLLEGNGAPKPGFYEASTLIFPDP